MVNKLSFVIIVISMLIKCDSSDSVAKAFSIAPDGMGRYTCDECGKIFKHPGSLQHHRHIHRGTHRCPSCGKAFSRRWDMERHLNKSKYGCPANRFSIGSTGSNNSNTSIGSGSPVAVAIAAAANAAVASAGGAGGAGGPPQQPRDRQPQLGGGAGPSASSEQHLELLMASAASTGAANGHNTTA